MREHPLLMKGPLVRATLEGRKTQTRRPINPQPSDDIENVKYDDVADLWLGNTKEDNDLGFCSSWTARCPLGRTGDRLWVRETWAWPGEEEFIYRADQWAEDMVAKWKTDPNYPQVKWSPSIHMPRRVCRLVLPLVSVRVERVQDITEEGAKAEGIRRTENGWTDGATGYDVTSARAAFQELWTSIYGQESWDANPWVWVAEWKEVNKCDRCDKPMAEEDERECDSCCQVLCWLCMYDAMLCNDCETSLEERATFPEEFEQ